MVVRTNNATPGSLEVSWSDAFLPHAGNNSLTDTSLVYGQLLHLLRVGWVQQLNLITMVEAPATFLSEQFGSSDVVT